jgi:hypothetical protein
MGREDIYLELMLILAFLPTQVGLLDPNLLPVTEQEQKQ